MERQSWEQYSKAMDQEGGSATLEVRMKWSCWSADVETWEEEAPEAINHMRLMYNNELILNLSSKKECRTGKVTIVGTSECEDAPGDLHATGHFFEETEDDPQFGGRTHTFDIRTTSVAELLKLVDAEEEQLIIEVARYQGV